jgi:hypothetical protein
MKIPGRSETTAGSAASKSFSISRVGPTAQCRGRCGRPCSRGRPLGAGLLRGRRGLLRALGGPVIVVRPRRRRGEPEQRLRTLERLGEEGRLLEGALDDARTATEKLVDLLLVAQDRDALAGVEESCPERAADVGRGRVDDDGYGYLPGFLRTLPTTNQPPLRIRLSKYPPLWPFHPRKTRHLAFHCPGLMVERSRFRGCVVCTTKVVYATLL